VATAAALAGATAPPALAGGALGIFSLCHFIFSYLFILGCLGFVSCQ